MDQQLHDLLGAAAGDPPHRVTVEAIRHRVVRRRVLSCIGAAAAVLLVIGVAAVVSAHAPDGLPGLGPVSSVPRNDGEPRYYVEAGFTGGNPTRMVLRATDTGKVTAVIRSPWRQGQATRDIIPLAHHSFLMICQQLAGEGSTVVVESRIYRFWITGSGRIAGYSLVHGGVLNGYAITGVAAVPSAAEIAVAATPSSAGGPLAEEILVINTRTGAKAAWLSGAPVPGTVSYGVGDMSLTSNGRELVFLGSPKCDRGSHRARCKGAQQEVLALSPAARGGTLSSARVLVRESQIASLSQGYINDAAITPDGSKVTLAVVNAPPARRSSNVSVIQASAATGRKVRVLYRMDTGNGFFYRFFSADTTGRYLILDAGPTSGTVNGWIDHGVLVRLKPAGTNVFWETW